MSSIDQLVRNSIRLRGDSSGDASKYSYGESLCSWCGGKIDPEGQEALSALASERGIYFRLKLPCKARIVHGNRVVECGGTSGRVLITKDEET